MKKINLEKHVDFNKYVMNIYPQYQAKNVFKAAVPTGLIRVDTGSNGSIILKSNKEVIAMINGACEEGRMSYFNETSYVFHGCKHSIEEIGNGQMVMITITKDVLTGYASKLWLNDEKDCPWWNSYIKKEVDGTRIHFSDKED